MRIDLGKLQYFTSLNLAALEGNDSAIKTIIYGFRSLVEVVMKFTQIDPLKIH